MDFFAAVFKRESHGGIFGPATFVDHAGGKELREEHAPIGRPAESVDGIGEKSVAAVEFVALEQTAALAVSFLDPDVVVLQIVFFGFDIAANGIDDAAVGSERESGDFVVDVLEGLVEILSVNSRNENTAAEEKNQRTETLEVDELGWKAERGHGWGWGAVYGWQQGF